MHIILLICLAVLILFLLTKRQSLLPLAVVFSNRKKDLITAVTLDYLTLEQLEHNGDDPVAIGRRLRQKYKVDGLSSHVIDMPAVLQEAQNPTREQEAAREIAKVVSLTLFLAKHREFTVFENIWPKARKLQNYMSMTYSLCFDCYQTLKNERRTIAAMRALGGDWYDSVLRKPEKE